MAVALGGGIGVAGSIVSNWFLESYRRSKIKKSTALAFKGEISSLVELVHFRKYIDHLKETKSYVETNRTPSKVFFSAEYEYFAIYKNYIDKIGLLDDPLPYKITRFYAQANAFLEDAQTLYNHGFPSINIDDIIRFYDEMIYLIEDCMRLGEDITSIINEKYEK